MNSGFKVGDKVKVKDIYDLAGKTHYSNIEVGMSNDVVIEMLDCIGQIGNIINYDPALGYCVDLGDEYDTWVYLPEWLELVERA